MAEALIDGAGSGYYARVSPEGRLLVDMSGTTLVIGSVSANVDSIYIQSGNNIVGSFIDLQTSPIDVTKNNPAWKFEYDAQNNLGSVTQFIGAGSFVNVLTWAGFSGTSIGVGSHVTNVGSYS